MKYKRRPLVRWENIKAFTVGRRRNCPIDQDGYLKKNDDTICIGKVGKFSQKASHNIGTNQRCDGFYMFRLISTCIKRLRALISLKVSTERLGTILWKGFMTKDMKKVATSQRMI